MNILINRKYVVSILGRLYTVGFLKMLLAYCYHSYKDKVSNQKNSFRIIGSYVSVSK